MSENSRWSLSEGFNTAPLREQREQERLHHCANISEVLGVDSDLPESERGEQLITPENSVVTYDRALQRPDCPPVIIGMPHAGELVPQNLLDRANDPAIFGGQAGLDTGTTSIFAPRNDEFVAARARVSRIVVDLNREPTDFSGKPPSNKGICWENNMTGEPIYKDGQDLTQAEKEALINDLYPAYFQKLHALAGSLMDRPGDEPNKEILFIDGHSFPGDEAVEAYGITAEQPKPLIIVGTGKGKVEIPGAREAVVQALIQKLEELISDEVVAGESYLSKKVALNEVWTGTKNIKYWGDKGEPLNSAGQSSQAIQIEVNRMFFMKDGKYDQARLDLLHSAMYEAIKAATEAMQATAK